VQRAAVAVAFLSACTPICPAGDCPSHPDVIDTGDGWDDRIGRGRVYAVSSIAIADRDIGFDLDGRCIDGQCIDHRLSLLGFLLNVRIENAHNTGFGRTIIELAGTDTLAGDDPRATLKMYEAVDWISPPDYEDDFSGDPSFCCQFYVTARSAICEDARWKLPIAVDDGVAREAGSGSLAFVLPLQPRPYLVALERPALELKKASEFEDKLEITLGGAVPAPELARILEPQCSDPELCSMTLLDLLVNRSVQPDIDLDGDGLETFELDQSTGRVGLCFDGCDEECPHDLAIAPENLDEPWSCVSTGAVRDGYSVALKLAATPATILEVR
jgi:hypothetical protein